MSFKRYSSHLSYLIVGTVSILLAVFISSRVVRSSYSQESVPPVGEIAPVPPPQEGSTAPVAEAVPEGIVTASPSENLGFLEPYVFDMREGRRNPFRPPQFIDGTVPDVVLPGTPLERYDLSELKLAGVMWDVKSPKAMIIDPQGEVHVIGKDDRIGRKRGYIAVIREGEVVVVETSNFNGENTYSSRVIRIDK